MSELTYPISPDYVKSWTVERAIAELIANALDEDPHATATWSDGVLTIEDNGPGIPEEGMILGYSPKDATNIGQFGEGAKIASLVLARAEQVGAVRVETVGYGFTPTVQTRHILDGIAPRRAQTAPQVLVYTFLRSDRTAGTRVTIECDQETAAAATARFRQLSEPGYRRPTDHAQVILTGPRGRLYIGGVLVSAQPKMRASYDFPLAAAKSAQNRDRTVIDADVMTNLVGTALAACADKDVIRSFAEHVLGGGRLTDAEKYFPRVEDPRVRAAFAQVGKDLFADRAVFYARPGVDEAALDLLDGDFELLTTNVDAGTHLALMRLLGVPEARVRQQERTDYRAKTKFVPLNRLPVEQRENLERAVDAARTVFGTSAVDTVKVFSETGDRYLSCADGFYEPSSRNIALRQDILTDPFRTLEVLLHEVGHRRAHRLRSEYADRSRGFENELGSMLATAVTALLSRPHGAGEQNQPAGPAALEDEPAIPVARAALAQLLHDALPAALERADVTTEAELSDSLALHRNYLRLLTHPRPAGWRQPPSRMAPSVVADPRKLEVLATAFGLRTSALWLGHMLCEGPRYGRTGGVAKPGPWSPRLTKELDTVLAELDALGGIYAAAGAQVRALASGEQQADLAAEDWQQCALAVLAAERDRLGLAEADAPAAHQDAVVTGT